MKLLAAIRRHFIIYENEKAGVNFLANVIACQTLALLQEGIHPHDISRTIQSNKTLKAYFIGLSYQANDVYKFSDFEYVLATLGHLLGHLLNHPLIPEKVDFVELLVQSFNVDRKNMSLEFEKGLELATADIRFYRTEGKFQFEDKKVSWDEVPAQASLMGSAFSFFKFVKATYQ
jgi:hypothetical protein